MVEVFTSETCPPEQWTRLGYVRMGENQSAKARERKTFRFKSNAKLVKFGFQQLLGNKDNLTNQISLTAVVIRGEKIPELAPPEPVQQKPAQPKFMSQNPHVQKADKIKAELQLLKQEAVQNNQYLQANRLKQAIQKISELQNALDQLELKKAAAIHREDYVVANTMKESIEQIQNLINMPINDLTCIVNGEEIRKPEPKPVIVIAQPAIISQTVQQQGEAAVQQLTQPTAPVQPTQTLKLTDDMRQAVPPPTWEDKNIAPDQRAIQPKAPQQFAMTEEEKAQYEAEMRKKALKKAQERDRALKKRNGEEVPDEPQEVEMKRSKGQQESNAHQPKFDTDHFDFARELEALCQNWSKEEAAPPPLSPEVDRSPEASVLRANAFNEIYIQLAASKNVDHAQDAIQFMECCLKTDYAKYSEPAVALANVMGQNINATLFSQANKLVCYAYASLLVKYAPSSTQQFKIDFEFQNVEQELVNQKENALIYAEMTIKFAGKEIDVEKSVTAAMGKQYNSFQNDVILLLQPMVNRISAQQKRIRMTAINMLTTISSFPCFPILFFTNSLIKKQNIDRIGGLNAKEQVLTNNKYFSLIEARATALSAIIQKNYFLVPQIGQQLLELIKWVFPSANKAEFKKSMIDVVVLLYESSFCQETIALLNQIVKNSALFKQIQLKCAESDQERGGTPRIKYVDTEGGRLIFETGVSSDQIQTDFPPGTCQFCLWESPHPDQVELIQQHLLQNCPCCCVCPACHLAVEIPVLPEHLCQECSERNTFQFKLKICPKCRNCIDERAFNEHVAGCTVQLGPDQSVCPLCNIVLKDTEEALDHYAEAKCEANPRTTARLKEIVKQKIGE